MVFPHAFVIPMSREMSITQWHVPVDDTHCYWYAIFTSFDTPVDKARCAHSGWSSMSCRIIVHARTGRTITASTRSSNATAPIPAWAADINVHDQWAVECMGAIQDRTREHLGQTDKAIIRYRRMLLRAIDDVAAGLVAPLLAGADNARRITGPASIDAIGPVDDWQSFWREQDRRRRDMAAWPAALERATAQTA